MSFPEICLADNMKTEILGKNDWVFQKPIMTAVSALETFILKNYLDDSPGFSNMG